MSSGFENTKGQDELILPGFYLNMDKNLSGLWLSFDALRSISGIHTRSTCGIVGLD